jgi:hypothetical protein
MRTVPPPSGFNSDSLSSAGRFSSVRATSEAVPAEQQAEWPDGRRLHGLDIDKEPTYQSHNQERGHVTRLTAMSADDRSAATCGWLHPRGPAQAGMESCGHSGGRMVLGVDADARLTR